MDPKRIQIKNIRWNIDTKLKSCSVKMLVSIFIAGTMYLVRSGFSEPRVWDEEKGSFSTRNHQNQWFDSRAEISVLKPLRETNI